MFYPRDVVKFAATGRAQKSILARYDVPPSADARVIWTHDGQAWLIDLEAPKTSIYSMPMSELEQLLDGQALAVVKGACGNAHINRRAAFHAGRVDITRPGAQLPTLVSGLH